MESTDSSAGGGGGSNQQPQQQPNLPPGFRFHPTDEELVVHYLKKKASSIPLPVSIIAEVDLYKFDPWELPAKATFGEQEWYFFSPRDRKYPNGVRPNRAATSGYWKATGTDKPVLTSGGTQKVGVKKALVFYGGKPPKGVKTNWIMHEYRLADNKVTNRPPGFDLGNKKNSLRLDDWVLCRIYKKNNNHGRSLMDQEKEDSMEDMLMMGPIPPSLLVSSTAQQNSRLQLGGKGGGSYGALLDHDQQLHHQSLFEGIELNSLAHANHHHNNNNTTNSFFAHLAAAAASRQQQLEVLPMLPPLKPSPSPLFWSSDVVDHDPSSSGKRFHDEDDDNNNNGGGDGSNNDGGGSSSIVSLLSQLPQTPSPTLHQQHSAASMLGSLGDGMLRTAPYPHPHHHQQQQLPGMNNWYS